MNPLAQLLIGYSVFAALLLAVTHFRVLAYQERRQARAAGLLLLAALAGLQGAHFVELQSGQSVTVEAYYRVLLFAVAPAFYIFARPLLDPRAGAVGVPALAGHGVCALGAPWLPPAVALPGAFLLGAAYLAWLARSVFLLRGERAGFRLELALLGAVFLIALGVAVLGVLETWLPERRFVPLYAIAIGLAFLLVQIALGLRPQLAAEVSEAAQAAYANSTLGQVDCDAVLGRLATLMDAERIFTDPDLSLPMLAARLDLSAHQLSELINTRLGKSFSRYLRERRIAAAARMLLDEPSASVLSVGLSVGFTSQSNFYEAFREIEGTTPGNYRKLKLAKSARIEG